MIDTMIRRVFVDQGISTDILFWRCFDTPGLTEKDLKVHSDDLVRCFGRRLSQIASTLCGSPSGTLRIQRKRKKFMADDGKVEVLIEDKSEAEKCHIATLQDSKDQLPKLTKPETASRIHLADLKPPDRKIQERTQPARELGKVRSGPEDEHATKKNERKTWRKR
ncbi:hypothetical protein PIB30_082674 [Stylosanthes scabra]|uniref:Uncharacterized protein n=1 Tax=Stylosanthes scabra TaxID=79078 RepID=A0ABU6SSL1_9FABA|nr:hypothetical protein [Stylosanthes scabra]